MLTDDVTIKVKAGDGGRGAVAFSKVRVVKGPTGASGGTGGSIYLEAVPDLGALDQFRYKKNVKAEKGGDGDASLHDGTTGVDLILRVPVGTVVHYPDMEADLSHELVKTGDRIMVARGGNGGKGNYLFRSSRNTTPKEFQYGLPGQERRIRLELKLIADVGFVGLPNVGKSSLLNEITNAKSKVANYQFTTLEPYVGAYYGIILADIPGIIEGASTGKGLGIKFLRHIERTNIIFHFVSAESDDVMRDYKVIRKELEDYNEVLADKKEYLFLSKSDMVSQENVDKKIKQLKKINPNVIAISIFNEDNLKEVEKVLQEIIKSKE